MSSRRPADNTSIAAANLRSELQQLKNASAHAEVAAQIADEAPLSPKNVEASPPQTPSFDQLNGTEQAAGSLGVHPDAWRPIKFMNNAHYDQLLKSNAIGDTLARRIEAFREVSTR